MFAEMAAATAPVGPTRSHSEPLGWLPGGYPRCGGRMRVIATIEDPVVIRKILTHLGLPTEPPTPRPRRGTFSSTRDRSRPGWCPSRAHPRTGVPVGQPH